MFWLITVILLLLFILLGRIEIRINTVRKKKDFYIVKVYFWCIRVYKTALCIRLKGYIAPQLIMVKRKGYRVLTDVPKSREHKRKVKNGEALDTKFLIEAISAEKGEICLRIGVEDAAATALLCGGARTIAETVLKLYGFGEIKVLVKPNFQKEEFSVLVDCILSTFLAQIIYRYFKQKGGS